MTRRFVLLTFALSACSSAAAPSTQSTQSTTPIAIVLAPPVVDPCAGVPPLPVDFGFACLAAGRGSYRTEVIDIGDVPCGWCFDREFACHEDEASEACVHPHEVAHAGHFRFVYVSETGARSVGEPIAFSIESAVQLRVDALAIFDFDGDGTRELAAGVYVTEPESGSSDTQFLTPEGAELVPYEPAEPFADAIAEVRDVDGDTRPDFISWVPWTEGGTGYSESSSALGGPPTLFHALSDGGFDGGDDVARAFTRERCGTITALLAALTIRGAETEVNEDVLDSALHNVTCVALIDGPDAALARFNAEWARRPCTIDAEACAALESTLRERIVAVAEW